MKQTSTSNLGSRHPEHGASAVIVAATLVLLMGMAAIAIDLGAGFSERRLDQTGADIGAVSGALDLALGADTQDVVDEILLLVDTNVRTTDATQWSSCADPGRLLASDPFPVTAADLGLTPATDCISFDTFSRIRVRVPNQDTDTTFGRVLGATSLITSAPAEAESSLFPGGGTPPPFVVLSTYSGGQTVCLRTGPSPTEPPFVLEGNEPGNPAGRGTTPDPCDESEYSSDSEMLGMLDPVTYFDSDGNIECGPSANDYFIAAGIDHPLSSYLQKYGSPYTPGNPEIQDGDGCTGTPKSPVNGPDTIRLNTGLTAQELRCGMLTSRNGACRDEVPGPPSTGLTSPARLQQGVLSGFTFLGEEMDNRPLWDFFVKDTAGDVSFAAGAPGLCIALGNQINAGFPVSWDYYDIRDDLLDCLNQWNPGGVQLFEDAIWSSPRFAFLPFLAEDSLDSGDPMASLPPSSCPASGGECVHIDDFVPVWIQTLYTRSPNAACDDVVSSGPDQWGLHHAGQTNNCGNANGNLDRLAAIVLDCGMISQEACDARPGPPGTPGGDLTPEVLLTR